MAHGSRKGIAEGMYRILILLWKKRNFFLFEKTRQKVILLFIILYWYAVSGFLYFELPEKPDLNWLDAMWWALVTMTTVGYGDLVPTNPVSKVVATIYMMLTVPMILISVGLTTEIVHDNITSKKRK